MKLTVKNAGLRTAIPLDSNGNAREVTLKLACRQAACSRLELPRAMYMVLKGRWNVTSMWMHRIDAERRRGHEHPSPGWSRMRRTSPTS